MGREKFTLFSGLLVGASIGCVISHLWLISHRDSRQVERRSLLSGDTVPLLSDLGWNPRVEDELISSGSDGDLDAPFFSDESRDQTVHAEGLVEEVMDRSFDSVPEPLPADGTAIPIRVKNHEEAIRLREIIDRQLKGLSQSQRDIWFEVLTGMSEKEASEILGIWQLLRSQKKNGSEDLNHGLEACPERCRDSSEWAAESALVWGSPQEARQVCSLVQILTENLHHVRTPGYRRTRTDVPISDSAPQIDLRSGTLRMTSDRFDLAIEGAGFFLLRQGEQIALTRCGHFDLGESGQLVQQRPSGTWILDPPINIPAETSSFVVDPSGMVYVTSDRSQSLGRVTLVDVLNPRHLSRGEADLLFPNERSGHPKETKDVGQVRQGFLERSNATVDGEMAEWKRIHALRSAILRVTNDLHQRTGAQTANRSTGPVD